MRPTSPILPTRSRGFSLIEVLVSMVVLAAGLLGIAGLQVSALRWTADSGNRSTATQLADELMEKVRSNPSQEAAYITATTQTSVPTASAACYGAGCNAAARVNTDIAEWRAAVAGRLPAGEAVLCRDASPTDGTERSSAACSGAAGDPLVIKFWWRQRTSGGEVVANSAPSLVIPVRP